ncbi:MAG: hypothetical protein ACPF97_06445 [Ilumatobacteraceae bacterium]
MWIRLRQICVTCTDLNEVSRDLAGVLGLEACFTDPGVAQFGLKNTLWPIGTQFLECVTPMSSDLETTAAGRYISRHGGDTGYMVICEVDDVAARRNIVDELGIRVAFELNYPDEGHVGMQLHPADTGGSFLEMDRWTMVAGGKELEAICAHRSRERNYCCHNLFTRSFDPRNSMGRNHSDSVRP